MKKSNIEPLSISLSKKRKLDDDMNFEKSHNEPRPLSKKKNNIKKYGKEAISSLNAYYKDNIEKDILEVKNTDDMRGSGLFTKVNFKKGDTITLYKAELRERTKNDNYEYAIDEYDKYADIFYEDELNNSLKCIDLSQCRKNKCTCLGFYINEPTGTEEQNVTYKDVSDSGGKVKIYKIVATKDIKAGDQILWCYGKNYARNYKTNCKYKDGFISYNKRKQKTVSKKRRQTRQRKQKTVSKKRRQTRQRRQRKQKTVSKKRRQTRQRKQKTVSKKRRQRKTK
jgi:hypothetical protein